MSLRRSNYLFGMLFVAWGVLLPGNFLLGRLGNLSELAHWWWLSTGILAVVGWVNWLQQRRHAAAWFAGTVAVGMSCAFLADLNGALPTSWQFANALAVNMPLFALGHVAFLVACGSAARALGLQNRLAWLGGLGLWLAVGLVAWYLVVVGTARLPEFRWPALGYTLLLAAATGAMTALAWQRGRFWPMALGAALFLASDVMLAGCLFRGGSGLLQDLAWLIYGLGEMLIVFGAVRAASLISVQASPYAELT